MTEEDRRLFTNQFHTQLAEVNIKYAKREITSSDAIVALLIIIARLIINITLVLIEKDTKV